MALTRQRQSAPALGEGAQGVLLILIVLLAYLPTILGGTFHYDDGHHVVDNPAVASAVFVRHSPAEDGTVQSESALGELATLCGRFYVDGSLFSGEPGNAMYRPTLMVVHALNHALFGYRPAGWLLLNVLIHALVAVLVWRLALGLGLPRGAAYLAGLVMGLHPIHTEVVNYVSSRSESTAAALMLVAMLLHLRARVRSGPGRAGWLAGSLVCSMLAVTAKETAALYFAAVGVLELLLPLRSAGPDENTFAARMKRAVGYGLFYLAPLVLVLLVRQEVLGNALSRITTRITSVKPGADPLTGHGRSLVTNAMLQSRVVVLYQQLLVRPVGLSVDHGVLVWTGWGAVVAALAVHLSVAAAAVRAALRGHRLAPLCVAWFWLFLAPSVLVPLNVLMNEHRLYLPGIAVSIAAGALLWRVRGALVRRHWPAPRAVAVACTPLLLFVPASIHRSLEWHSDHALWASAVERTPTSARAHLHLGAVEFLEGRKLSGSAAIAAYDRALDRLEEADRLHPRWFDAHMNMGNTWLARARITDHDADFERALACYDTMGEIVGRHTERWRMSRAEALTEWRKYDEALVVIDELDVADDSVTPIYDDMRARTMRRKGDVRGARAAMQRVIELQRGNAKQESLLTLGWWFYEDAVAARARPSEADALLQRCAVLLGEARDIAQANRAFRPNLYMARFLRLVGVQLDQAQKWEDEARELGWKGIESELTWVNGGATPGVRQGTPGIHPRR